MSNEEKIQEMQLIEQSLHHFLIEKQSFQVEVNEVSNAISELKKTTDDAYRILGGIMLKADKEVLVKELQERKKLLELRISSIEKQESALHEKAEKLRADFNASMTKKR